MVWMEDNICIYRYGEILHTSAVLVGTIHVIQGIYINWREPVFFSVVCQSYKNSIRLKCIFNFQLARVKSSLIEITSAHIYCR